MTNSNSIYSCDDEYGNINVLDDGKHRILSFAEGDEQSKQSIATPYVLQHEYTQAMMLVLLFKQPKRITLLGLGGGCLLTTLHHHIAGINITAVELRQNVIDIAERFFRLPRGKKIQVIQQCANQYLERNDQKKVDILFTDIYNTKGMDESVLQQKFIEQCDRHIKEDGWLVLNCWSEHTNHPELIEYLRTYFLDIRALDTGCGNWVILASKSFQTPTEKQLKNQAQKLSSELGFNATKWLSRLNEL